MGADVTTTPPNPGVYCLEHGTYRCGYGFGECQGITTAELIARAINGGEVSQ